MGLFALVALTGCSVTDNAGLTSSAAIHGYVGDAHQPVSGSAIQLYEAGTQGAKSAATPILASPVRTDAGGHFVVAGTFTCASPKSQIYLVATGGSPGLAAGTQNAALTLMTVLGSCDELSTMADVSVNEVTTAASLWPLSSYMASASRLGSASGDPSFSSAITQAQTLIELGQAGSSDTAAPADESAAAAKLNTLANALHPCVYSTGGVAGDGTACGDLFSLLAAQTAGDAPTNTLDAALRIAQNSSLRLNGLFQLASTDPAFQPALAQSPADWQLTSSAAAPIVPPLVDTSGTGQTTVQAAKAVKPVTPTLATAAVPLMTLPHSSIYTGSVLTGNIRLSQPAGSGGVVVSLQNSSPAAVQVVPSVVVIAAGQETGTFTYTGVSAGSGTVTASAPGLATASATVSVAALPASSYSGPLTITKGGTYSGKWSSSDPSVPAVTILTDQPVIIQNSIITGPGSLIWANTGGPAGIHLQVSNVLGIEQNPNVTGLAKGNFLTFTHGTSLEVDHSTMIGVNNGIAVVSSTMSYLQLVDNTAIDVDDRASNGQGGMETTRPEYGHTILLSDVAATQGANIGWNQLINQQGVASVEDIISVYDSQGASNSLPITIHDNYVQGAVTSPGVGYSGGGIITDGGGVAPESVPAFVMINNNQVVDTENYGLAIAAGHDVTLKNNRVFSTGRNASGAWLEIPGFGTPTAYYLWNCYNSSSFYNNQLGYNYGALVRPDGNGNAVRSDLMLVTTSVPLNDTAPSNAFLQPSDAAMPTPEDESSEYFRWEGKLQTAGQTLGISASLLPAL
jgi:hypothetical protein